MRHGFSLIAPQFEDVGGGKFSIGNLKPTGSDLYGNVAITQIDSFGGALAQYVWSDCGGKEWNIPDVWVDNENNVVTDVSFLPGEALWTQASSSSQNLQSSGQVPVADAVVQLRHGFTLAGNAYPIMVKVNDLLPSGNDLYGNIAITIIDSFGGAVEQYVWSDCGGVNWDIKDVWVDGENNVVDNNSEIGPGQGLWVQASSDAQFLTFPAPEIK